MRSAVLIIISLILCFSFKRDERAKLEGNITISGAFALYPMAIKWAEEFRKIHPEVHIDVSAGGAGKGITDVLSGMVDIGLLSRDLNPQETKKGAYPIAVTKDAVVPTISEKNPLLKELLVKGVKKKALMNVFITANYKTWGQVLETKSTIPLHAYIRSDAAGAAETWANYFGKRQEDLEGTAVFGDPGLAQAVKRDPVGIGFNNIVYIYDLKTKRQTHGFLVLPIDLNDNGKIDPDENFYNTIDDLVKAVADGRYPSPPARDLFFVTKGIPKNKIVVEFIKYVLTEGQKFVHEAGYVSLDTDKVKQELVKLK